MKSEDRLEKRADLEYDVLVKRKETKQVKSPAFESGIPPQKKAGKIVVGGKDMYIIAGLGNPGKEYERTRHNTGFMVLDRLSEKLNIEISQNKFKGLYGKGKYKGEDVLLLKPQTYMNLSGESVRQVMDFFKISQEDILVVYDDLDMPVGKLRLRQSGSAGGHNGIKNIILHTGSQNFNRIRVGIDRSKYIKVVDYVLSRFTKDEQDAINQGIENASDAVIDYLDHGFNHAMNRFN